MTFSEPPRPNKHTDFTSANPDPLFDTAGAARYLCEGNPPAEVTMERWRRLETGPRWIKMSGIVRYQRSDLDAYITQCTRQPGRAAGRRRQAALRSESTAEAR